MIEGKPKGRGIKIYSKYPIKDIEKHCTKLSIQDWQMFRHRCDGYSYKQIGMERNCKTYFVRKRLGIICNDLDKLIDWNEAMK